MDEIRLPVSNEVDIVEARQKGKSLADKLGFSSSELTLIATAISEVSRNILRYAKEGYITLSIIEERGLLVVAEDEGPGIADIALAMQDGFSTSRSLGLGLPGARRLMDEFEIESEVGKGTTIKMIKWKHRR